MAPAVGAAIVSSIGNAIGNLFTNSQSSGFSEKAANLAYQRQVEQWNRENQYNLPINQMSRYAAAGLNPNLVYTQNNGSGSLSGVQQAETPHFTNPLSSFTSLFGDLMQVKSFDLHQQEVLEQMNTLRAQQEEIASKVRLNEAKAAAEEYNLTYNKVTEDIRKEILALTGSEKQANIAAINARRMLDIATIGKVNAETLGLQYNNQYLSSTMQSRIDQVDLYNGYLRANAGYLESKKNLTDEEKVRLGYINTLLRKETDFWAKNPVAHIGGLKYDLYELSKRAEALSPYWNNRNTYYDADIKRLRHGQYFNRLKNFGWSGNAWSDFPYALLNGFGFFKDWNF